MWLGRDLGLCYTYGLKGPLQRTVSAQSISGRMQWKLVAVVAPGEDATGVKGAEEGKKSLFRACPFVSFEG